MDCKHASHLISQSQEARLSWRQRFGLRFHLMLCDACTQFSRQLGLLREAARQVGRRIESDERFFATNAALLRNPSIVNFLDGCAFTLPCHAPGALPVGLMLGAPGGHDAALAGVALAVEAALAAA